MRARSTTTGENNMRNRFGMLAVSITVATLSSAALAADDAKSMYMNPSEVKWGDAPPVLAKGAKVAVLMGDPGKAGPFVMRLQVPANYKIAPHWHTNDEDLTVISGSFFLGEGDKMDMKSGAHEIKTGGFHHLPGKAHHFAWSRGPAVVQVNGNGPFDITYIDPKDDPSKAARAAAPAADAKAPAKKK
jgi:hypothetical protein